MSTPSNRVVFIVHLNSLLMRLGELRICGEEMERILSEESSRIRQRLSQEAEPLDPIVQEVFFDEWRERVDQIETLLPRAVRSAFFGKCVSEFESLLILSARVLQRHAGLKVSVSDLREDGLKKASIYFIKVADLQFPTDHPAWSDLLLLSRVRNFVVHSDSRVPADKLVDLSRDLSRQCPEVVCDSRGNITITETTLPRLIDRQTALVKEFMLRCR